MYQSLVIVDDFYDHPLEVRRRALACDYPPPADPDKYPGRNSRERLLPEGLDRIMCRVLGETVVGPRRPQSSHGRFRVTLAGEEGRFVAHVDPTNLQWAGIVYLTLPEHCKGGTAFYRHRGTDSDRAPLTRPELELHGLDSVESLLQRDGPDPAMWEHLMTVPMRFNRLIVYRPWLWHSAGESFGSSPEDCRLIQLRHSREEPAERR